MMEQSEAKSECQSKATVSNDSFKNRSSTIVDRPDIKCSPAARINKSALACSNISNIKKKKDKNVHGSPFVQRLQQPSKKIEMRDSGVGLDEIFTVDFGSQTENEDDLRSKSPLEYWRRLAESHRQQLEKELKENAKLCNELRQSNELNDSLKIAAEEARQLTDSLQKALKQHDSPSSDDD